MKRAICFLKNNKRNVLLGTTMLAKEYCLDKDFEFVDSIVIDLGDFEERIDKILDVLYEKKVDIILSNNDLPLYAKAVNSGLFFDKIEQLNIQWFDFTYDCPAEKIAEPVISFIDNLIQENHVPVVVICEDVVNPKGEDEFQEIVVYINNVLHENNYSVIKYNSHETDDFEERVLYKVLLYMPCYIVLYKDLKSEDVKAFLNNISEFINVITYDEVLEASKAILIESNLQS